MYVVKSETTDKMTPVCKDILEFEKLANFKFDAIVKARPDVVWYNESPPATMYLKRVGIVSHLYDQHIISARNYSDGMTAWYKNYASCNGVWHGAYHPEKAYRDGFQDLGADYRLDRRMPMAIRRENSHTPSAAIACSRSRIAAIPQAQCMKLVYHSDSAYE
jgi:hypothetical protein